MRILLHRFTVTPDRPNVQEIVLVRAEVDDQLRRVVGALLTAVEGLLETAAARKSRELQAILGSVLNELRREGDVLVTLERQQPVYHVTVARPLK